MDSNFKSAEERFEVIVDTLRNNNFTHHTTIITGSNGSGKSVIRKSIRGKIEKEIGEEEVTRIGKNRLIASLSMERRTSNDGIMNIFNSDTPWTPTSENTFHFIRGLLDNSNDCYVVLDEPEIGMSEEMQLLLCSYFNDRLAGLRSLGVLIITHSRTIVKNILHDQFINLDGMTEDQWINRIPQVPAYTIEEFEEASHQLFLAIQKAKKK